MDLHCSMTPQYLELDLDRSRDLPEKFGAHGKGSFAIPFESFIPEKIGFLPAEKTSRNRAWPAARRVCNLPR